MAHCRRCVPIPCSCAACKWIAAAGRGRARVPVPVHRLLLPAWPGPLWCSASLRESDGGADEAVHQVISIRGRSGSVLGLLSAKDEGAPEIARCVQQTLSQRGLEQVERIATDPPSVKLHSVLGLVLPHLRGLSLDPTHAAMRYEQATSGRKTAGSILLRSFMAKFWSSCGRGDLGANVHRRRADPVQSTRSASAGANSVARHACSKSAACHCNSRVGHCLARRRSIHWIYGGPGFWAQAGHAAQARWRKRAGGRTFKFLYVNLTIVEKVEWLFNSLRYRRTLSPAVRLLLPSGTTSNEALRAEINAWFRQIQSMHRSTLALKIKCFQLGKLLAHNAALYNPSARQMPSGHVFARCVAQPLFTSRTWTDWIAQQEREGTSRRAHLPLAAKRAEEMQQVRGARKKPAQAKRKRTPFTLERVEAVPRAGRPRRPSH